MSRKIKVGSVYAGQDFRWSDKTWNDNGKFYTVLRHRKTNAGRIMYFVRMDSYMSRDHCESKHSWWKASTFRALTRNETRPLTKREYAKRYLLYDGK